MVASGKLDSDPKLYTEIYLKTPIEFHEATCNYIIENYSAGLVIEESEGEDERGIIFYVDKHKVDVVELQKNLSDYINGISDHYNFTLSNIRHRTVKNQMWEEAYRNSIKPIMIDDILIRPPWYEGRKKNKFDIIIEPKMAFGTGTHETTRLCVKLINMYYRPGMSLLDLGCGSGILSILAAKISGEKKSRIVGIDIDPIAVENSIENIGINNVADKIEIFSGSIEQAADMPQFDFVVANIILETITKLFEPIHAAAKPGGTIALSGLLLQDRQPIENMLRDFNLKNYKVSIDGEWLAFHIIKNDA